MATADVILDKAIVTGDRPKTDATSFTLIDLGLPRKGKVVFRKDGFWEFPVGTVFVKHFSLELSPRSRKRLETRLFVRSPRGWAGYTYRWNDEQTEAYLLGGAATEIYEVRTDSGPRRQTWSFPSRTDCMTCHQRSSGFVLGPNTRQLNRPHAYGKDGVVVNQLQAFAWLGLFTNPLPKPPKSLPAFPDWKKQTGSLDERARAYLHVNCAMCHTPPGYTKIDLRYQTPLKSTQLLGQKPEKLRVGPANSRLIAAGDPHRSELYLRLARRGPGQMPNIATSLVDERAKTVIVRWIQSLMKADSKRRRIR